MTEAADSPETRRARLILGLRSQGVSDPAVLAALEHTPRDLFTPDLFQERAWEDSALPIACGQTISQPFIVGLMTQALTLEPRARVLEIGTGSGYQSAVLSNLTANVFSIEIIAPLYQRTRALYDSLIARGYGEYAAIQTKTADGYYGWAEAAPFDKIIVTCGIDHIPPPLLQQLKPDGVMVIPVGPPGAQHVLKAVKAVTADGFAVSRSDIYNGAIIPFVPFTGGHQS